MHLFWFLLHGVCRSIVTWAVRRLFTLTSSLEEVKLWQARTCLTWVLLGVILLCLDKPSGGVRVKWSVSVTACHPPHPATTSSASPGFSFCLKATCLLSIDGSLLTSAASNIPHSNLWSSVMVQRPLTSVEWEALFSKKKERKNNNCPADSHPFM